MLFVNGQSPRIISLPMNNINSECSFSYTRHIKKLTWRKTIILIMIMALKVSRCIAC